MAEQRRSVNDQINYLGEIDQWARYTIERLQRSLKQKKIGKTGKLIRSFARELKRAGGNVQEVFIRFAMYGRLRDMGVGRGVRAYERKTNRENLIAAKAYGTNVSYSRRQPKRWLNKVKMSQIYKLREILAENMAGDVSAHISEEMDQQISVKM